MASSSSSPWACTKCTFLNPPSQKHRCQVCLSPSSLSPLSSSSSCLFSSSTGNGFMWSCRACTFANPPSAAASCEACGTTRNDGPSFPAAPSFSGFDPEPEELAHPAIGSIFLPLLRCGSKRRASNPDAGDGEAWRRPEKAVAISSAEKMDEDASPAPAPSQEVISDMDNLYGRSTLTILSYNVWFNEELEVHGRMEALGNLIQRHSPDFICFQEVTPYIYEIFKKSNWWKEYSCSLAHKEASKRPYYCMQMSKLPIKRFSCKPFYNSQMGRELCLADVDTGREQKFVIATSHLESPCPGPPTWDQMFSKERATQANEAIDVLKDSKNVILCGDMNWDDKLDGAFPLRNGWLDAWLELRPGEDGWTYDTKANQMLSANRKLQKRLDRFLCKLQDFKVDDIRMIGTEAIPGLSYCKEKKLKQELKKLVLPVLPSDHFGLLLTISKA